MGVRMNDDQEVEGGTSAGRARKPEPAAASGGTPEPAAASGGTPEPAPGPTAEPGAAAGPAPEARADRKQEPGPDTEPGAETESQSEPGPEPGSESQSGSGSEPGSGGSSPRRRPPSLTTDTARPEGGGRAAPGDAPAPARQWPLLTVLALVGAGLLIVGLDPFAQAFRIGALLVGAGLLTGAALRRILPSVGMLAVRSRFTDLLTYGLLGGAITLLALLVQPEPWLELPFLEDVVRFTFRE
ncbi:DUF3017 domain-containing protein [Streptomyces sp. NPDC020141]|uniref:DUF3017 domain-containing protein n=1 Tax=Streptomyces sp. NPDC020141 TaxID=3365065 RepID=UPI0037AFCA0B